MEPIFKGCATAIITPMRRGSIDYSALGELIERQIEAGVSAIVPCGTTGEAPTLCKEEKRRVIAYTLEKVRSRAAVIAGCGSPSTSTAADFARVCGVLGVDGVLCVTPYYNKATDEGIYLHYKTVAEAGVPIIVYNVPTRTGLDISESAYERLCTIPGIVGVKEASGSVSGASKLISRFGDKLSFYCGCDEITAPFYSVGGGGVISVASNLVPDYMVRLTKLCECGTFAEVAALQQRLAPLFEALSCEVNPIPIKYAMATMGHCYGELRLPMCKISPKGEKKVLAAMKALGLI